MKELLLCPICQERLEITHQDRYESLDEHVSDPNGTPSMKDGYECSNENCKSRKAGAVWTSDGSLYLVHTRREIDYAEASKIMEENCKDGIDSAIGSWQRSYDEVEKKRKKNTIKINLHWIMIEIEPRYYQDFDETPETMAQSIGMERKAKYRWKFAGRLWRWYKKREKGSYVSFSPVWDIFKYKRSEFKRLYHKALQKNERALRSLMKIVNDTAGWSDTHKENRYWYRVANRMMRIWYKKEFDILKNIKL